MIKYSSKGNLKGKSSQSEVTARQCGEVTASGAWSRWHCTYRQKSETMMAGDQFIFSFLCSSESQPREWCRSQWTGFSISVNPIKLLLYRHAYSHLPGNPRSHQVDKWDSITIAVFMLVYSFRGGGWFFPIFLCLFLDNSLTVLPKVASKLGPTMFVPAKAVKKMVEMHLLMFLWLVRAELVLSPFVLSATE